MKMRLILGGISALAATSLHAAPIINSSVNFAGNGAARDAWVASLPAGSPISTADFETVALGNIHGIVDVHPGITITASNSIANVTNLSSALGGSNPIGTQAVALLESQIYTIDFTEDVDYFSLIHMDLNSLLLTVHYSDGVTTFNHSHAGSGSTGNTGVFYGWFRNDQLKVDKIVLNGNGGDGEWGLDNIEYGVVPEPASLVALGVGAMALIRRRRSK